MTEDKRARLEEIKKRCWVEEFKWYDGDFLGDENTGWLITELEAAWAEGGRLRLYCEVIDNRAEAAEKRVKVLEEALNSMVRVASRGHVPDDVFDAMARIRSAALAESAKQMEEKP